MDDEIEVTAKARARPILCLRVAKRSFVIQ